MKIKLFETAEELQVANDYIKEKFEGKTLETVKLTELVDLSPDSIIAQKITFDVLRALRDEYGYWRDLATVYNMVNPKEKIPILPKDQLEVREGYISDSAIGGKGATWQFLDLDTSREKHQKYIYVGVPKFDADLIPSQFVNELPIQMGIRIGKYMRDKIIDTLLANADEVARGSATRWKVLGQEVDKIADNGFEPNRIVVRLTDLYKFRDEEVGTGGVLPFTIPRGDASTIRRHGEINSLFDGIRTFGINNHTGLVGSLLLYDVTRSVIVAVRQDWELDVDSLDLRRDIREWRMKAIFDVVYNSIESGHATEITGI